MTTSNQIVIYDLEYTSWPGSMRRRWSGDKECREIVRIGAVRVDCNTLNETGHFDLIIKPTLHNALSDYCAELLGISEQMFADEGRNFNEGISDFLSFVDICPMVSFGWDVLVLLENFKLKNIDFEAKTLVDQCKTDLLLNKNDSHSPLKPLDSSNQRFLPIYGPGSAASEEVVADGLRFCVGLSNDGRSIIPSSYLSIDIKPWFHSHAPETIGEFSGNLARALGAEVPEGDIHNPLYDVRSILKSAQLLIETKGSNNFFQSITPKMSSNPS